MLRILAGEARGRRINVPPAGSGVRPILGRIKKSLFDILRTRVPSSSFLDLFAGSGSVGLEALSRGAARAVFVEENPRSCRLIRENLVRLGFESRGEVVCCDVLRALAFLGGAFDLVFMGPPYRTRGREMAAFTGKVLEEVARQGTSGAAGWVVCQHHAKEVFAVPKGLLLFRQEKYGDSRLVFLKCSQP